MNRFSIALTTTIALSCLLPATGLQAQIHQNKLYIDKGDGTFTILTSSGAGTVTFPGGSGTVLTSGAGSQTINGTLSLGQNGAGGTTGQLNLLDGSNPGSTGSLTYGLGNFNLGSSGLTTTGSITGGAFSTTSTSGYEINGNPVIRSIGPANIFLGVGAGSSYVATGSGYCVGIGVNALRSATTAWANTAVGEEALSMDATAQGNTAMGWYALRISTTGIDNTALGVWAMPYSQTGNQNSAVGANALYSNSSGNSNTAIGDYAGQNNTTESNNTYLGAHANLSTPGISNATAVGAFAQVASSNTIQLGSGVSLINTSGAYNTTNAAGYELSGTTVLSGTTLGTAIINSSLAHLGVQGQALNMGTHQINNVVDPTSSQDVATKNYVDGLTGATNLVTTFSAGTTGLTPASASNGDVTLGGTLGLANGGTNADLSATGGTSNVLMQQTAGGAIAVAQLSSADLSDASNVALLNRASNTFTGDVTVGGRVGVTGSVTTGTLANQHTGSHAILAADVTFNLDNSSFAWELTGSPGVDNGVKINFTPAANTSPVIYVLNNTDFAQTEAASHHTIPAGKTDAFVYFPASGAWHVVSEF